MTLQCSLQVVGSDESPSLCEVQARGLVQSVSFPYHLLSFRLLISCKYHRSLAKTITPYMSLVDLSTWAAQSNTENFPLAALAS